jgi:AcrR family transcriptional regulator
MPYLTRCAPDPEPIDCRILTAALDLFVENGYHNVSIHEVQRCANVSIGSIYKHFGGKEGIANALYKHILGEIEILIDSIIKDNATALGQCEGIVESMFRHTESHPNILAYVFHAKHSEFITEQLPICDAAPFLKMRNIIQNGIDNGEIVPANTWVVTASLFGAMSRLIQLRLDGSIETPLTEHTAEFIRLMWSGVCANTQALKTQA